jgi:RHH-type proline utilization regulon transcriptional repressor/proline dehydrogenase/delta 1-pyrroline-5-carboxylate dehydrogenase
VGPHKDLLAYLVRRLLENGANGSFVYQIADADIPAEVVAADPIAKVMRLGDAVVKPAIRHPSALFEPERLNSEGLDLGDPVAVMHVEARRDAFRGVQRAAGPLIAGVARPQVAEAVVNPAVPEDVVGTVASASVNDVDVALGAAVGAFAGWSQRAVAERAELLRRVADAYEANRAELFALLAREAGKTLADAVAEVREAVDFLRYYAGQASDEGEARGVIACISPWNFPLAIFTGQIAAALAAGNVVVAKPAPQTPLIAFRAVEMMHAAGLPQDVIQLLPGDGATVGAALTSDPRVAGVVFTGSLQTARQIERTMAEALSPDAVLIAETGGLNAMIVDSTALPEQAVRDIVTSAFQSAGQRCSALRILYVQEEAAERAIEMLKGAMDELSLGDPWELATDVGPVIDAAARDKIEAYVEGFARRSAVIKQRAKPEVGTFVGPAVLRVAGIEEMPEEIFGPVLHVATFKADELDAVIGAVNRSGYGLTFGLHTRISSRVRGIEGRVHAGNIYVNRNQIGAVVGSQPFGGEGLSGTGPKAGGPHYVARLRKGRDLVVRPARHEVARVLPGPTGESNVLYLRPRGRVLCLGPSEADRERQVELAQAAGCVAVVEPAALDFDAVMYFGGDVRLGEIRKALSQREGVIVPLLTSAADAGSLMVERHVCIDTTAAGGNASLLASSQED